MICHISTCSTLQGLVPDCFFTQSCGSQRTMVSCLVCTKKFTSPSTAHDYSNCSKKSKRYKQGACFILKTLTVTCPSCHTVSCILANTAKRALSKIHQVHSYSCVKRLKLGSMQGKQEGFHLPHPIHTTYILWVAANKAPSCCLRLAQDSANQKESVEFKVFWIGIPLPWYDAFLLRIPWHGFPHIIGIFFPTVVTNNSSVH